MVSFGHAAADAARSAASVAAFRRQLVTLLPMLRLVGPPHEL
jgi:hypothetical protein